ncbi:MAG: ASKHA domain-containing protein [Anaerolineales bacterium]
MSHFVHFEPLGRRGEVPEGENLLEIARALGVELESLCGGTGTCGRCRIQILSGEVSQPTASEMEFLTPEDIAQGYRMACCTTVTSDCKVSVPPESLSSPQRTQVEGEELPIEPDPIVRAYPVSLPQPTLEDLEADAGRLIDALERQHGLQATSIDIDVLRRISPDLREHLDPGSGTWRIQAVVRGREIIGFLAPDLPSLGLAVDLGTTKIALYLLDLNTGQTLAAQGLMNPQIAYGEDIIARISYIERNPSHPTTLRDLVVTGINKAVGEMCTQIDAEPFHISDTVIVGNTAMHHVFLNLPLKQLARAPYIPAVSSALDVKARDLGLEFMPGSCVHLPANIAGFVGADHVAMLLAVKIEHRPGTTLAIDIGTNTEICLRHDGGLISASCASGPAFEGAHIKHGMRAANGAIEHLRLFDDTIEYQTIGGAPPVGLCGSGILDTMAQLYLSGVLDEQGRMHDHPRVRTIGAEREFVLVDEREVSQGRDDTDSDHAISFTQKDVRELQLAKGAMSAGIKLLLKTAGVRKDEIDTVIVAGAFGTYIDITSAITVGMLPDLPLDRYHQVGNAAGMGAKLALISRAKRDEARELAARIRYVELATHPDFQNTFAQSMFIGLDG